MTDDEALLLGCKVAGGKRLWVDLFDEEQWHFDDPETRREGWWCYADDDPALPAHVAELLVAKVVRRHDTADRYRVLMTQLQGTLCLFSPAMQRARAALVALGHEAAGEVE